MSTAISSEGRGVTLALASLLLFCLLLRWPIASLDIEHYVGPDEGEVVENVLEMMKTGDFDHRHPGYPGLHFYLQMLPAMAHLKAASWRGEGDSIPELPRSGFYLAARRLTLLAGLAVAAVAFWTARLWMGAFGGLVAAGLVALSPLAFRESAVVNPDLMLALFVALSLFSSVRLLGRRKRSDFIWAGVALGLATAIKYTGAFALAPLVLGYLLGETVRRDRWKFLASLGAAMAAFALASPYTFYDVSEFVRGLGMHVGYYTAADRNAALELLRVLFLRGLGPVAATAALVGVFRAFREPNRRLLVVLAYPCFYLLVFAFFDRAFPRHALVLLAPCALLAADVAGGVSSFLESRRVPGPVAAVIVCAAWLAFPLWGSLELARRSHRPTAAARAARWVEEHLPAGSRVLQDQFTPRLDPGRYRVHRLRVEEKKFVGNFDWVIHSGYPPGLSTDGLREVARFEPLGSLASGVVVYQVPDRESLMPVTLPEHRDAVRLGAGELPYFGEGWYPPEPGAFGTSRLSRGESSRLYFVLPRDSATPPLRAELAAGPAIDRSDIDLEISVNGVVVAGIWLTIEERASYGFELPREALRSGLNEVILTYGATGRRDRRHRDTALRLFGLELSKR